MALSHVLFLPVGLNIAPRDIALLCQKVQYSVKLCYIRHFIYAQVSVRCSLVDNYAG